MSRGAQRSAAALQERTRDARGAIDPTRRLQMSEAIHTRLSGLPSFQQAEAIAVYFSIGSQVMTGL